MTETHYVAPQTLDEAVSAYVAGGDTARILAGGTDLLVQMRCRHGSARADRRHQEDRRDSTASTEAADGGFLVGALPSPAPRWLEASDGSARSGPACSKRLNLIGSTQVQGRASAGGNLCNGSPAADSRPGDARGRRHGHPAGPERAPADGGGRCPRRTRAVPSLAARRGSRQLHPAATSCRDRAMPICG